jgi:hypothetical protein
VVISGSLLYFYPITEAKRQQTRITLADRQDKLDRSARRGSLQQNGIPVDRTGATGFGPEAIVAGFGPDVITSKKDAPAG